MTTNLHSFKKCKACALYKTRRNVVLGSGSRNCDILFISENPNRAEDLLNIPITGSEGRLLQQILQLAFVWSECSVMPTIYKTYVCACIPLTKEKELRQPTGEEVWACFPRFEYEVKRIAKPKEVVFLGKIAQEGGKALFPNGHVFPPLGMIVKEGGASCPSGIKFTRNLSEIIKKACNDGDTSKKEIEEVTNKTSRNCTVTRRRKSNSKR